MATWWVSTSGTDTASGTNYASAWKRVHYAMGRVNAVMSKGDTLNIVNDGTHVLVAQSADFVNSFNGTNFTTDRGLLIQGTDSSGDPALAEIQIPNTNGTYELLRSQVNSNFFLVQGLHFTEAAGAATNASVNAQLFEIGSTPGSDPWKFQYCSFDFGADSAVDGNRWIMFADASRASNVVFESCFFRNLNGFAVGRGGAASLGLYGTNFIRCIFVNDHTGQDFLITEGVLSSTFSFNFTHCTMANIYDNAVTTLQGMIEAAKVDATADGGMCKVQDNLYIGATDGDGSNIVTKVDLSDIFYAQNAHTFVFSGSGVDYNGYIGQSAAVNQTNTEPYDNPFSDGDVSPKTNDVTGLYTDVDSMVNGWTSTYTWTVGAYEIEIPDLRPTAAAVLSGAADGGVLGALDGANQPPVAGNVTYTVTAQNTLTATAGDGVLSNSSDPDLDTLTASLVTNPSHGALDSFNTTTGAFEYTPNTTYAGTDTFTFKVSDGVTFSSSASAIITVTNQTPTGQNQNYSTQEGVTLNVTAGSGLLTGASDPDGHTVSVATAASPSNGTLSSYNTTTGAFTYVPDGFFVGTDSFTFRLTDGITNSATYTASITVTGASAPAITNVIDTAPFFKPDLRVETIIRYKSKKNRRPFKDLVNYTDGELWEESTHRIINLATNSATQLTLGGVATGEYLMVETDYPINVAINDTGRYWSVTKAVAVALTSFTTVYLQNESTTNEPQVIVIVVD